MGAVKKKRLRERRRQQLVAPEDSARRRWLAPVLIPSILVLFVASAIAYKAFFVGPSPRTVSTNAHLVHDPSTPRRTKPVYREKLEGNLYVNEDLGFSLTTPTSWTADLGSRNTRHHSYEGLVFRSTKSEGNPRVGDPVISLVRRTLKAEQPDDPLKYVEEVLVARGGKAVEEAPRLVDLNGRRAGFVRFRVPSAAKSLTVAQYVFRDGAAVFIFTASSAEDRLESWEREFEEVVRSFRLVS